MSAGRTERDFRRVIKAVLLLLTGMLMQAAVPAAAQCPRADRAVELKLTLGPAPSETLVMQRIPLCVRHEYRIALATGQRIDLSLTSPSNQQGMLTLVAPSGQRPADGINAWSGAVQESGVYTIEIGSDMATSYTLKVVIR